MALGKRPRRIVACDGSATSPAVPGWWRTVDTWGHAAASRCRSIRAVTTIGDGRSASYRGA
ncbi:hypothetical protein GGR70_003342 [Xanthomonas campestris]|nr:hypothetical protein [Xanthomonas campestris]